MTTATPSTIRLTWKKLAGLNFYETGITQFTFGLPSGTCKAVVLENDSGTAFAYITYPSGRTEWYRKPNRKSPSTFSTVQGAKRWCRRQLLAWTK